MECYDISFHNPSSMILSASSQSGKTYWIYQFLKHGKKMLETPEALNNVIFYYDTWQDLYTKMTEENLVTEWIQGIFNIEDLKERTRDNIHSGGSVVIIDDLMDKLPPSLSELFTVVTHHNKLFTIVTLQNAFPQGRPWIRTASLNAQYNVFFKQVRDKTQILHFLRQFAPNVDYKWTYQVCKDVLHKPYSYLLFDSHQKCNENIRIRSNVFNESGLPVMTFQSRQHT